MKEIELTKGFKALVDDEDFERVNQYNWCVFVQGIRQYAGRWTIIKHQQMHRFILDLNDPLIMVDHIDHNGLNNQKSNLRLCTRSQNMMNQRKTRGSSKYKGVHFDNTWKRWKYQICLNGKRYGMRSFKTEEEAALAYNDKAIELFGEFACLNVIEKQAIKELERKLEGK